MPSRQGGWHELGGYGLGLGASEHLHPYARLGSHGEVLIMIHFNEEEFIEQSQETIKEIGNDEEENLRQKIKCFEDAIAVDCDNYNASILKDVLRKGLSEMQARLIYILDMKGGDK
jgi:hypothetical protein